MAHCIWVSPWRMGWRHGIVSKGAGFDSQRVIRVFGQLYPYFGVCIANLGLSYPFENFTGVDRRDKEN